MAQRTQVLLIDDLDGSAADETVTFGLDGSSYEVDLSSKNAHQLRDALADYVAHGRKSAIIRTNGRRRFGHFGSSATAGSSAPSSAGPDTAVIRAWARTNGYAVNDRGRIAAEIVQAYQAAH